MLILTRKLNQKLIINDDIEIVILDSNKNSVKIGVNAPRGVQIYREEIYNEIKKSNKQSINTNIDIDAISNLNPQKTEVKAFNFMQKVKKSDN